MNSGSLNICLQTNRRSFLTEILRSSLNCDLMTLMLFQEYVLDETYRNLHQTPGCRIQVGD